MTEWAMAVVFLFASISAAPSRAEAGMDTPVLWFWAGPDAKNDKRVIEIRDHHACSGQLAYARVSRMPAPKSKGSLQPELVVELSISGSVVQRWATPVDKIVLGVSGNQILVPYHDVKSRAEKVLLISSDQSLSIAPRPSSLPKPNSFLCPRILDFGKSDYLRCFEFREIGSNVIRHLAYEGPCT